MSYSVPPNEAGRLAAVRALNIVGTPPEIEIFAGDRKLREPGRDNNSALAQAIENVHKSIAPLGDLTHGQDNGYEKNEADYASKQQRC